MSVFAKWSGPQAPGRPWPEIPAQWRAWRWLAPRRDVLVAPLCGAIVLAALALPGERFQVALLGFCALAGGAVLARRVAAQAALLPLMRHFYRFIGPFLGLLALALQASLLVRHAPPAVADAFCAGRLGQARGRAFGTLPAGVDGRAIVERALA